jgi:hypothetical protein
MSSGRKKSKPPKIVAPPPTTRVEVSTPSGDRFVTVKNGSTQTFESYLTPETRSTVEASLKGMQTLAQELNQPDAARQNGIDRRAQDFFDLQAANINSQADSIIAKTRSNLAKRFGGAYNATFGTNLLAGLEGNRLGQLAEASKQASLLGEDLYTADENSRVRRFTMFQNYLADLNNQARGLQSNGSTILLNESQRESDLAVQRANLAMQLYNQDMAANNAQARQDRENVLKTSSQVALGILGML